jgi:cytoskeletal protein RodZ
MSNDGQPSTTLGEELKRRREQAGIDLGDIAQATCIGVRFLRAIEDNDFKALPGGLFTRSFIRSYARYVGMDENAAIRLYFQQTGEGETPEYDLTGETVRAKARSSMWTNVAIVLAVLLVLILGGIAGMHHWKRPPSTSTVKPVPARVDNSTGLSTKTTSPPATPAVESPATSSESGPQDNLINSEPSAEAASDTTQQPSETAKFSETNQTRPVPTEPGTSPSQMPPLSRPTRLSLSIRATDECWISIQSDAGALQEITLRAGQSRVFEAKERLVLTVGNLSHASITINGQAVQLPHTGQVVKGIEITPQNLSQFIKQ